MNEVETESQHSRSPEDVGGAPRAGSVSAVVLAGDRRGNHPIFGGNKALLEVAGRPILCPLVEALAGAEAVARVIVVGPQTELEAALADVPLGVPCDVVAQGETVVQNTWLGLRRSLTDDPEATQDSLRLLHPDAGCLLVTCDLPLLQSVEVDRFLARAVPMASDFVLGMMESEPVNELVGQLGLEELSKVPIAFREALLRQTNLQFVRPFGVGRSDYFDRFYEVRHQKSVWNALKVAAVVIAASGGLSRAAVYYLSAQASMRARLRGRDGAAEFWRRKVPIESVCRTMGSLLRARFHILQSRAPGGVLDLDTETDWRLTDQNYERLRAAIDEFHRRESLAGAGRLEVAS